MADVLDCPIATVTNKEGAALGAAILAGVGTGVYSSVSAACNSILRVKEAQIPDQSQKTAYESYYALYRKVYNDLKGNFNTLSYL